MNGGCLCQYHCPFLSASERSFVASSTPSERYCLAWRSRSARILPKMARWFSAAGRALDAHVNNFNTILFHDVRSAAGHVGHDTAAFARDDLGQAVPTNLGAQLGVHDVIKAGLGSRYRAHRSVELQGIDDPPTSVVIENYSFFVAGQGLCALAS